MYNGHNNDVNGDFSFMEDLLPKNITAFHMDSYNNEHGKRFQGAFYYTFGDRKSVCNDVPLEILKLAINYQTHICQCMGNQHITWTIWF